MSTQPGPVSGAPYAGAAHTERRDGELCSVDGAAAGGAAEALDRCRAAVQALYAAALTDRAGLRAADLQADVEAAQSLVNAATALQLVRIAQYAATTRHLDPLTDEVREVAHPLGHAAEFADVDLAPGLAWSPRQATARVEEAIDAVTKTPRLLDEMAAGAIDAGRVRRVTDALLEAPDSVCVRVEDALLDRDVQSWSSAQITARTRRLVQQIDPAAARSSRARRAVERIGVFTAPGPELGLTEWTAVMPTDQAARAYAAVDGLARELHRDTTTAKTLGQCRVDAMTDLVLQRADITTEVTVTVPVLVPPTGSPPGHALPAAATSTSTATPGTPSTSAASPVPLGQGPAQVDDRWVIDPPEAEESMTPAVAAALDADWDRALAELIAADPGPPPLPPDGDPWWDVVEADAAEQRERQHATAPDDCRDAVASCSQPIAPTCVGDAWVAGVGVVPAAVVTALLREVGPRITRALVNAETGALLETYSSSYRPTAAIRRLVRGRDEHCRFPGCSHPARFCETDHVVPWPHGATTATNLQLLCKHHHRAKHEAGWSVAMSTDGTCTWTSPHGRTHVTRPSASASAALWSAPIAVTADRAAPAAVTADRVTTDPATAATADRVTTDPIDAH
ncbi:HNH endonuclease signature motif containing protein [Luteipulveratus flavus]|uniref:HNH endonuclease signature motif containing protein n=1 Tax=Luteipulveratus flavus TaxID=3031728 RepID=A0ABT6C6Z8_9MICO|nr:HNH endonuclease signature motif containing protein [Luteipulveratus sp. YIM 133296]MDF8263036.1 HNH endonuclease signature motif containing protein [Luteipulveratus sp. YIM 133296]